MHDYTDAHDFTLIIQNNGKCTSFYFKKQLTCFSILAQKSPRFFDSNQSREICVCVYESSSIFFFNLKQFLTCSISLLEIKNRFLLHERLFSLQYVSESTAWCHSILVPVRSDVLVSPLFISVRSLRRFTVGFVRTNCRFKPFLIIIIDYIVRLSREMRSPEKSVSAIRGESETTLGVRSG